MGNKQSYGASTTAATVVNDVTQLTHLADRVVIITGGNGGIGKETARVLALAGATVIIAARTLHKGEAAAQEINQQVGEDRVTCMEIDMSSLESVRSFAQRFLQMEMPLHVLLNNAGIMALPEFVESKDGYELQFATNHLGHFLLTELLLDKLKESAPSRIVIVASSAHTMNKGRLDFDNNMPPSAELYEPWKNYAISKLSNILHARELNERLSGSGVTAYSLHPGVIKTALGKHSKGFQMFTTFGRLIGRVKTIPQGAATSVFCCIHPEAEASAGMYFMNVQAADDECADEGKNLEDARSLYEVSMKLVELDQSEQDHKEEEEEGEELE